MPVLSVLLVEDSALFRIALASVLPANKTIKMKTCSSGFFLRSIVKFSQDVLVIDAVTWTAGPQDLVSGVEKTAMIAPVILLGREDLLGKHMQALRAGAVGFVRQTAGLEVLIEAVRAVGAGEVWFESEVFRKVFVQAHTPVAWPKELWLSEKEHQILSFIASGKTNKEIGTNLGVTERSVKGYVSNLFRKIGVANRSALTSYAILHGIMPVTPNAGN